jgi:predicted secreted protein
MRKYLVETIPLEATKFLSRLNAISDEAWKMVEQADKEGNKKIKIKAPYLAQDSALHVVIVFITNKALVDDFQICCSIFSIFR